MLSKNIVLKFPSIISVLFTIAGENGKHLKSLSSNPLSRDKFNSLKISKQLKSKGFTEREPQQTHVAVVMETTHYTVANSII